MVKKQKMTLEKLAQITANGFSEVNDRFDGVDKRFDGVKNKLSKVENRLGKVESEVSDMHQDMFRQNRILMAEVERNDHQDDEIKAIKTKI